MNTMTYPSDTGDPRYTNKQAVMDALKQWEPGTDKHGYDLAKMTYRNLRAHGSAARPMDATILRYLRYYGCLFGVTLKDRSKSLYTKKAAD